MYLTCFLTWNFRFLTSGLNLEDINYFKASYQMMLDKPEMSKLLNYTHWVDHSVTEIPDPPTKKKKVTTVLNDYNHSPIKYPRPWVLHRPNQAHLSHTLYLTLEVPFLILSAPLRL